MSEQPDKLECLRVEVAKLNLQPGDAIVVRCLHDLKVDQARLIAEHIKSVFPGHRVLVLASALSLEVVGDDGLYRRLSALIEHGIESGDRGHREVADVSRAMLQIYFPDGPPKA